LTLHLQTDARRSRTYGAAALQPCVHNKLLPPQMVLFGHLALIAASATRVRRSIAAEPRLRSELILFQRQIETRIGLAEPQIIPLTLRA
jgi:hypothetical protein